MLSAFYICTFAQERIRISGFVFEETTGFPVSEAVLLFNTGKHVVSKNNGYYTFSSNSEIKSVKIYKLGYDTLNIDLNINKDSVFNLYLVPFVRAIEEVYVTSSGRKNAIQDSRANVQKLERKELALTTGFMGQKDVFKAIRSLPGIANGGEGNSGLFVRGGTGGQNLTLFNDAIIYNPMHMLGLFSVFNPAVTENVVLHKAGVPSEHPGRLSALVDVKSERKINDSLKLEADISPFSVNAGTMIPISPNWSIGVWGRKTFMNQTVWPVVNQLSKSSFFDKMNYDFYDFNFLSNIRLGTKDAIYLSAYSGGDDFGFGIRNFSIHNYINWVNTALSATWIRVLNNKITLNNIATYSGYRFNFGMSQEQYSVNIKSDIQNLSYKSQLDIDLGRHQVKAGLYFSDHRYKPNTPSAQSAGVQMDYGAANIYYADESAIYITDDFKWNAKISANMGARLSYFRHKGPYSYVEENGSILSFDSKKTVRGYLFVEPSVSLNYQLKKESALKIAFTRSIQPVHLISVTAVNFPADFWIPSVRNIRPAKAYQGSIGYHKNLRDRKYEGSATMFYKNMTGLTEFSGGIMNLVDNMKIEDNLYFGRGDSWGMEFFVKKNQGRFGGWLSYTLAFANRKFNAINDGEKFPFKYDRRHDLSLVWYCKLNELWNISTLFTFASGNAYTQPISRYMIGGNIVNEYGAFNGSRMPAYHRMDISAGRKLKPFKNFNTELSISVYNIYNRRNPMYMFYMAEGDLTTYKVSIQPKSVSLLPILPAINYKIYLK